MTTRMLFKSLFITLLTTGLVSCSLFSGGGEDEAVTPDEMDQSSISNSDDLTEDEGDGLVNEDTDDSELDDDDPLDADGSEISDEGFDGEGVTEDDLEVSSSQDLEESALEDEFEDLEGELGDDEDEFSDAPIDIVEDELGDDDEPTDQVSVTNAFIDTDEDPLEDDAEFTVEPLPEDQLAAPVAVAGNNVVNLEYKSFANGGTVVIETSSPADYNVREEPDLNQVIIEVDGVNLPEKFKRPYITKDFKQDVATINAYQVTPGGTARFVIQMKRPLKPEVQQNENTILVMTSTPVAGDDMQVAAIPLEGTGTSTGAGTSADPGESFTASGFESSASSVNRQSEPAEGLNLPLDSNNLGDVTYKGKIMNLEVADTDVRDVIQIISEESGVNLIMDQDVKGKVSFRLRKVPWDQALMVVLKSQALGYKRQGNVLRIAKQATLSNEAQQISKQIESEKEARLLAGGLKVKYIPVSYAKVEILQTKLKDFSSKNGKVTFDNRTSSIVISDYAEYIERISKLVKAMDVPPMQVEIEAKIIEARESFAREVGINWGASGQPFTLGGGKTGFAGINSNPTTSSNPGLSMDFEFGTFDVFGNLSASFDLFESQNKIKVLSAPKILAMNKVPSQILQNTQIPIQQVTSNGGGQIAGITYRDLVLSLDVTPQITFAGDVIMDVKVKREFANIPGADGTRELNSREAKTTVMVKNGQTAVIGGIYQSDSSTGDRGIPLLKDIPFIGGLFRQSATEKQKNELLVFLKPRVLSIEANTSLAQEDTTTDFQQLEKLNVDEGDDFEDPPEEFEEDSGVGGSFEDDTEAEFL